MKSIFTKEEIIKNKGCYSLEQVEKLSFIENGDIKIEDIVNSEIRLKDKFWFIFRKCELTIKQKQELCIGLAEITLDIYEKKYPNNKTPREAVQAAKQYLNNEITIEALREKRQAAADAADAAYAADAADAAAYAAYADDAAYAAAYAAYAAYAAAYAADASYAADAAYVNGKIPYSEMLLLYLNTCVSEWKSK